MQQLNLSRHLSAQITQARLKKYGKAEGQIIVEIKELDKVNELIPTSGAVNEQTSSELDFGDKKDLMAEGVVTVAKPESKNGEMLRLDLSQVLCVYTMNFGADIFGFSSDPRFTTVDDVSEAMEAME